MTERLELFLQSVQRQRDDTEFMRQLAWTLWIVVLFMLPITLIRQHADLEVSKAQAQVQEAGDTASHYSKIVAACMDGREFVYVDPHTDASVAIFCHRVILGRPM